MQAGYEDALSMRCFRNTVKRNPATTLAFEPITCHTE